MATSSAASSCDDAWPGVADEVALVMGRVVANSVHRARQQGCHDVQAYSQHWTCLFPQHGAGAKHLRRTSVARREAVPALDVLVGPKH